jgi:DNA repair exonuclease SbcCD nuclease subunit
MPLTFIHAADFHLGADLRRFGRVSRKLKAAQFQALENTIHLAAEEQAAFILICGDLFDQRNPSASVLGKAAEILSAGAPMPVYILPGTHDFLGEKSVFSPDRTDLVGDNLIILNNSEISPIQIPDYNCWLYFNPNRSNRSASSPIQGLKRRFEEGFHIGLAHGSLRVMGLDPAYDYPLDPDRIAKTGLDYLALGHWHKNRVEKYGQTTTAYSGTPQPISWSDPGKGAVLVVKLEDTGEAEVTLRAISEIDFLEIREKIYHPSQVKKLLQDLANPKTIVKMALKYSDNLKERHEVAGIIKRASARFLLVQSDYPKDDQLPVSLNHPDRVNKQFHEAFKAELAHLKEADNPERSELYEKAAKLGAAIIAGEE